MNQRICKQLRRQAKALVQQQRATAGTQYTETENKAPKQCGFIQETLPSGTTVTVPWYTKTIKRVLNPDCQRAVYHKLKQQVQHPL